MPGKRMNKKTPSKSRGVLQRKLAKMTPEERVEYDHQQAIRVRETMERLKAAAAAYREGPYYSLNMDSLLAEAMRLEQENPRVDFDAQSGRAGKPYPCRNEGQPDKDQPEPYLCVTIAGIASEWVMQPVVNPKDPELKVYVFSNTRSCRLATYARNVEDAYTCILKMHEGTLKDEAPTPASRHDKHWSSEFAAETVG